MREPDNRPDYAGIPVALVNDVWVHGISNADDDDAPVPGPMTETRRRFLDALAAVVSGPNATDHKGRRAATKKSWADRRFAARKTGGIVAVLPIAGACPNKQTPEKTLTGRA